MKNIFRVITMVYALLAWPGMGWSGQQVTVFAAASLKDALDEVAGAYPGEVIISYGGSGMLARQVALGAPADAVLLANEAWMDWLEERGAINRESRVDLLGNTLVLVGPKGAAEITPKSAGDLLNRLAGGRLAVGQTRGVPAGIYARQWLENGGFWEKLQPHLAETENVRTALALVSRHEVPMGVVYGSDALADPGVTVIYQIPDELHDPITYPMAAVKGGDAADFMAFIQSNQAHEVFAKHGFIALGALE